MKGIKTNLLLVVLLFTHLYLLINLRFTPWPEMLSYPYLFNNGFTLYKDFVMPYPPVLVLILAFVYKLFSYNLLTIKIFTWVLILLSDIYIYRIVKRLTKKNYLSLFSVAVFVFLQPFLEGNMLWFDTFLVLPILISTYYLLNKKLKVNTLLLSGLFLAITLFSKQTALIYVLVASIFVFIKQKSIKNVLILLLPSTAVGLIFLGYILLTGSFVDFWNWNLIYPFVYWSDYPMYVLFKFRTIDYVILLGLITPFLLVVVKNLKKIDKSLLLLTLIYISSLLAVYPRFSYYHLAVGISFSCIFLGLVFDLYKKNIFLKLGLIIFALLFFWYQQRTVLAWDWKKPDRFYSESDIKITSHIKDSVKGGETIHLGNIHSGVYIYSKTLPPKPWYDNFGWYLEIPGQQEKIISSWKENPPEKIYWKTEDQGPWYLPGVYKPEKIKGWINENYVQSRKVTDNVWMWEKR